MLGLVIVIIALLVFLYVDVDNAVVVITAATVTSGV